MTKPTENFKPPIVLCLNCHQEALELMYTAFYPSIEEGEKHPHYKIIDIRKCQFCGVYDVEHVNKDT